MKGQNSHLEAVRKKLKMKLSPEEMRSLLHVNPESKNYERLDAFYSTNEKVLVELYGKDDTREKFQQDLRRRWNVIEDLLYFKHLEENLTTREERTIRRERRTVQGKVSTILEWVGVKGSFGKKIQQIRDTRDQDIISGNIPVNEELIVEYVELVRKELKEQITKIQNISEDPTEKKESKDMYSKASSLIHFMVSRSGYSEAQKRYLTSFLLKKIRSEEGFGLIQEFFRQSFLTSEDAQQGEDSIKRFLAQFEKSAQDSRIQSIWDVLKKYAPNFTSPENLPLQKEMENLLKYGTRQEGDITYNQQISLHLQQIEMAEYQIYLEKMVPGERTQQTVDDLEKLIKSEVEALESDIQHFSSEKNTIEEIIKGIPSDVADELAKVQLQEASFFLKKQKGASEQALKKSLHELDSHEKAEAFLKDAERTAEDFLCENAQPPFQREALKALKKNAPYYNVFVMVTEQERYENRPKAKPGKPNEYHEQEDQLKKIEELIHIMEVEVVAQFQTPGSEKRFEEAHKAFEKLQSETSIVVEKLHYLEDEEISSEQHERIKTIQEKVPLMLPGALWNRFEAVLLAKDNLNRFKRSRESILKLKNFEGDESQLKEGLAAFFTDYFEVKESKGVEVGKLTKVMSLDHPITAIRFNAADKKPFDSRRGFYDFHKLNGRPATYKERSVALLKTVQDCLRTGDYSQIQKLFNRGEKADRLYMDSLFFPINTIRNEHMEENIVYDTTTSKETGEKIPTFTTKIPDLSEYDRLFGIYKDKESTKYKDHVEKYQGTLNDFDADNLAEDESFVKTFEETADSIQMMRAYLDSLSFQEDGSAIPDFEKMEMSMGETAAAGLLSTEDLRIDRETLLKIQKQSPLIAARAAQFNSIGRGYALGGLQLLGREVRDITRLPGQFAKSYGKAYWKVLKFYSVTSIFMAFHEFYEHVANLADFGRKFKAYTLLKDTFAGTIIGSEFAKLQQAKENERVDAFKGAFAQYGNEDIRTKLLNPRDRFELKATLIEGFDNRGLFTIEDILRNEVFEVINKYTPAYIIPKKYSDKEMVENPDAKSEMTNHVRAALDSIWGQGTWSGYRTNGASKYEANRKAANDNFNNNTGPEKMKVFTKWWEYLTEPDDDNNPLKKIAPSELVGSIENDMQRCNNDSGEIFAIMQALICKGYVRLEHLARLQDVHTNDLPIYTLLEPEQARLCGMTDFIEEELKNKTKYDVKVNPIVQFYQGKKALRLKASRDVGKWKLHKSQKSFDEANEEKKIEFVDMTAHELQKTRELQPNFIKKSDNGVTGINGPSYSIEKIFNAMNRNAQGDIDDARDHDIVALYRGMHEKMAAYMKDLTELKKPMDATQFKRTVYNAYAEIGKTCAFATYLAGHEKRMDYDINLADGSPNRQGGMVKKNGLPKELSAFEKLIIPNTGRAQRLNESNDTLDAMPDDGGFKEFRFLFKMMAGYQYTLGVLPNGKKSGKKERYPTTEYRPSYYFEKVIESFQNFVLEAAKKREENDLPKKVNFQEEIRQSLDRSAMAKFDINNDDRQRQLNDWKVDEALLD